MGSNVRVRYSLRAIVLSALLVGGVLCWRQPLRQVVFSTLRFPFTATKHLVMVVATLPRLPSLARENAELQAQLTQRQLETAQLREALRHAQHSEHLLQVAPQGMVAAVLARSPLPTQQTVLLDKGARHGLTLDSVILDASGVVGRIIDIQSATSLVMLLTDSESRVAGLIERSRETGLLIGRGQGSCELIYLDVDADIQEGDRLVTAGLGGAFPKGLPLGTVTRVVRDEEAGTALAWVALAARLGQLEEVLCLPPTQ